MGNGRFEPNPSREVTERHGSKFLPFGGPSAPIEFLFWDHWERAVLGQILAGRRARVRSREVMGGYGRLREVTEEENGEKWKERQEKGWKKTKENEGKSCTVIKKTRGMAELLGAQIFLGAMRETRHGGLREQQVTRDRYTGAYYRHRCLFLRKPAEGLG